jgi:hypothetical protein
MRIGLISYHPSVSPATAGEIDSDFLSLCQYVATLPQYGYPVNWLASTDTAAALAQDPRLVTAEAQDVPATCRYVVPYQAYRFAGVPLLCVDSICWQRSDRHTRLFTLLCLLQRERPCTVLHAWGPLDAIYMVVYTASYLGLPAVVSYGPACQQAGAQQPFLWQWVAQHTAAAVVATEADRESLVATTDLPSARVHVIGPTQSPEAGVLAALYGSEHNL